MRAVPHRKRLAPTAATPRSATPLFAALLSAALVLAPAAGHAGEGHWTFDATLYMLGAAMSGQVTVQGVEADVDVPFDTIWENLEFGAMGSFRAERDDWSLTTEVIYMGLGASKNNTSADFDQWVVEETVAYRLHPAVEALAGLRYNRLEGVVDGPLGRNPSDLEEWLDPIVGAHARLPLGSPKFLAHLRADIGGFGVGSDLAWQLFPYVTWRVADWGSLQGGYRWLDNDYQDGSGRDEFRYDILSQGPQAGFTFHF